MAILRDERGQVIPLLAVMIVLLMAAGMVVFLLGISTGIASTAQSAADAAALAGEQKLVDELQQIHYGANGQVLAATYDRGAVCKAAQHYAALNHGTMSCPDDISFIPVSGLFGTDVEVTVHSQNSVPNDSGSTAVAKARASTDPYSQASPPISTVLTCDASVVAGDSYDPPTDHGSAPGFFTQSAADYTQYCEPKLAGKLEALAKAKRLHLVGVLGYATATPSSSTDPNTPPGRASEIQQAHACGAASETNGMSNVDASTLKSFGLARPIRGAPNEIELAGAATCKQTIATRPGQTQPVLPGNSDVHLVDLNGGPVGAYSLGLTGLTVQANYTQDQLGCIIWGVDQQLQVGPKVTLATFLAAWAESTMRNITSYTPNEGTSLGLFQQQASEGWGTAAEETDPVTATKMFLEGAGTNKGAIEVNAEEPADTPWKLTEDVQHSKFSDGSNYAAQMGSAQLMLNQIQGGLCDQFKKK
jgi:hypothetical protein